MAYRIYDLRVAHGWSQQQLADRAGVSQSQVHKWEAGQADPTTGSMMKLANCFDVSMDYLCGRTSGDDEAAKWDELEVVHIFQRLPPLGQSILANIAESLEDTFYGYPGEDANENRGD